MSSLDWEQCRKPQGELKSVSGERGMFGFTSRPVAFVGPTVNKKQ